MTPTILRSGFLVAAMVVLQFTVAMATPTPCTSTPRNHVIEVTRDFNSCEHANVSMHQDNKIDWYAPDGTTLAITFTAGNPYKHFGCGAAVNLPKNKCRARNLTAGVKPGEKYEYSVSIDQGVAADPSIIIHP